MSNFRIFTESKADVKFIKDYIEDVFDISLLNNDFDTLGSWSGYKAGGDVKASIKQNKEDEKLTVLILDADVNFDVRQQEIMTDFEGFGIPVKLFLFPSNIGNGALENLLCAIAIERKIIECFESYQECIRGYEVPVTKSKIYAYLDALLPANQKKSDKKDMLKEENRDYRNADHWDLKHHSLNSLKDFLSQLFP